MRSFTGSGRCTWSRSTPCGAPFLRTILPGLDTFAYTGIRLLSLPILMGLGYEIIRFSGKHDNIFTRILSAPGLWVQRITTKEPTEDMLEVAIISLKGALRDEVPEFMEFYTDAPWEVKAAKEDCADTADSEPTQEPLGDAAADRCDEALSEAREIKGEEQNTEDGATGEEE